MVVVMKMVAVGICKEVEGMLMVVEVTKLVAVEGMLKVVVEEVREEETSCDGLGGSDGRLVHQQIH